MKKSRRFLSALLFAALLFALIPVYSRADAPGAALNECEARSEPQAISTADELIALARRVNSGDDCAGEAFLLTEDIALNDVTGFDGWSSQNPPENTFIPIGDGLIDESSGESGHYFAGSFDGGGHSVSGAYIRSTGGLSGIGLFGVVIGGEIKNLTMEHCYIPENGSCVGGLVGKAQDSRIADCSVSGRINGAAAVGGLVGEMLGGSVAGCSSFVTVVSENTAGALVGSCASSAFSNCRALGSVEAAQYAGGIAGIGDNSRFFHCVSEASVSARYRAASIAGFCFSSLFYRCTASGSVSGLDHIGGIAGICLDTRIELCENTALVDADYYVGGAAGRCCGTEIIGFINSGTVIGRDYVGGVAGWSEKGMDFGSISPSKRIADDEISVRIRFCRNDGSVGGEWGVGGIVGDCHETEISDCYNTGEVVSNQFAGGITGYTADCIIERCYNAGSVVANHAADALIGRNSMDATSVNGCFYLDTSCEFTSEHGTALTHELLMLEESYQGFDFSGVWLMDEASEYPYAELRVLMEVTPGDVDANGTVNIADALNALRAAMGVIELAPNAALAADMDGSGGVTIADAVIILRRAMGVI